MKKTVLLFMIFLISIPVFAASNAVVKETKGKVEFMKPGSSSWVKASPGDEIPEGSTISTGFRSSAVIEAGESVLTIDALTRIELEELMQQGGNQTTGLFLRVGKVNAEVKRDTGLTHNFRLRSPSSTAAVRGTNFTFDGRKLIVNRGAVALIGQALAREMLVQANEKSRMGRDGRATDPADEKQDDSSTDGSTVKTENGGPSGPMGSYSYSSYGSLEIIIE